MNARIRIRVVTERHSILSGGLLLLLIFLTMTASFVSAGEYINIKTIKLIQNGPSPLDRFRRPSDLVTDQERQILIVADNGRGRVVLFDASGRSRGSLFWTSDGPGAAAGDPRTLAISKRGQLCVVDGATGQVEVLTATGSHLGFMEFEEYPELERQPRTVALCVGNSGRFYVLRAGTTSEIAILEPNGILAKTLRLDSAALGSPVDVDINDDETVLAVADPQSPFQVKLFSLEGKLQSQFGSHGEGDGTFSMAIDVTWGPANTLWVTDTLRHSISVFNAAGEYLDRVGGFGYGPGQFNYPAACEFLADDRVVVLERGSGRFQIIDLDMQLPGLNPFERRKSVNEEVGDSETLVYQGKVNVQ